MTALKRRRGAAVLAGGVATLMLLAACSSDSSTDETAAATEEATASEEVTEEGTTDVAAGCEAYADYMGNEGASVSIFTSILPPEQGLFEQSWSEFESCTGIDIVYEGSDQFEAQLPTRIAGGNAPDIAFIPQPGLLAKLVSDGGPVVAPEGTVSNVDTYWNPAWKSTAPSTEPSTRHHLAPT